MISGANRESSLQFGPVQLRALPLLWLQLRSFPEFRSGGDPVRIAQAMNEPNSGSFADQVQSDLSHWHALSMFEQEYALPDTKDRSAALHGNGELSGRQR